VYIGHNGDESPTHSVGTFAGKPSLCYHLFPKCLLVLHLEWANPWRHIAVTTICFTVVPNYCGFSVRKLLHVTFWRLELRDGS